ncbi:MAG: glycosyltransferase family 9 protein [Cyanobacteria bacterium]|nr:glycosyltransferase family 9 protein [Cyanobacteriota bacterium]
MPLLLHNPRVLLIRLSALGDVIHGLPAAAAIKQALPQVKLSWVVEPPFVELLSENPAVDEVIVFPKKALKSAVKQASIGELQSELTQFISGLRHEQFDAAIDLQGLFKSAAIAFLSGAPVRVGFAEARELAPLLYTHRLQSDYFSFDTHVVDHNVALAEFLLKIVTGNDPESGEARQFPLPRPAPEVVERLQDTISGAAPAVKPASMSHPDSVKANSDGISFVRSEGEQGEVHSVDEKIAISKVGVSPSVGSTIMGDAGTRDGVRLESSLSTALSSPVVAFIPGTTWTSKIWPQEKWVKLADQLLAIRDVRIVILGGPSETEVNRGIQDAVSKLHPDRECLDMTGQTSLRDLVALYQLIDVAVGVDTGPLHLACAAGVKNVIGVFGSTPTGRNGPYGPGGQARTVALGLSCQPCFKKTCPLSTRACLVDLDSKQVLDEIVSALS